jgi:hypothetical protein
VGVRQLCAARLIAGVDSAAKKAAAAQRPQQAWLSFTKFLYTALHARLPT